MAAFMAVPELAESPTAALARLSTMAVNPSQSLKGSGFKANYFKVETGEQYWISGPRKDGTDRLYKSDWPVEIDEDVREEYWTKIRKKPDWKTRTQTSLSTTSRPNATSLTRM